MATPRKAAPKATKKIEVGGLKMPVSFEQFSKNPIAAVAFCMLIAVGYLYYDQKTASAEIIAELRAETKELKNMVYQLKDQVRKSDSLMSAANSKIVVLQQLGKIPE